MPHHDQHDHHNHNHDDLGPIFHNKMVLPVLIIALTLALMTTFQMRQILTERKLVKQAYEQQEQPLSQVQQVNKQFESLAVGTARLAGQGNATAQGIVADLRRVGISVNPNAKGDEKAVQQIKPETAERVTPAVPPPLTNPAAKPPTPPVNTGTAPNAEPAAPATGN